MSIAGVIERNIDAVPSPFAIEQGLYVGAKVCSISDDGVATIVAAVKGPAVTTQLHQLLSPFVITLPLAELPSGNFTISVYLLFEDGVWSPDQYAEVVYLFPIQLGETVQADPPIECVFDPVYIRRHSTHDFATPHLAASAYLTDQTLTFAPSALLQESFYHILNPDTGTWLGQFVLHYLQYGRFELRQPHPLFNPAYILEQAAAASVSVRPETLYFDFLADQIPFSPHPLIDLDYVREQLGNEAKNLGAGQIFRLLADPEAALPLAPHPLFDPEYYRRYNQRTCANELIDYVIFRSSSKKPSPLFDDDFYTTSASHIDRASTPLEHYLQHWSEWLGSPSLCVDVAHLNHMLMLAGVEFRGDPLSTLMRSPRLAETITCHPHLVPRMLRIAFSNICRSASEPATLKDIFFNLDRFSPDTASLQDANPDISIIILNYHKPVLTFLSVCAALNAMRGQAVEIIVIENGGELFHFETLTKIFSQISAVRLIKLQENRYFGEGNNLAVDVARGKYVFFLNNDCCLLPDFGVELFHHLSTRPTPECVGACLLFPDGTVQEFGGVVSDSGEVIQRAKGLTADFLANRTEVEEVDYVSAACAVLPRSLLSRFGGFDPAFEPFYYEDTDLMRRLRAAGIPVVVNPALRALHIENATTGEFLADKFHPMIHARSGRT